VPDYRNIAVRVAHRHVAGLIDLDLAAAAAQYVLRDPAGSIETDFDRTKVSYISDERDFEYGYESRAGTWDHPPDIDTASVTIDLEVPSDVTFFTHLILPARMLAQVSQAQREEFMVDVMNRVVNRMRPDGFLLTAMHGTDGLAEMLNDKNPGVSFMDVGLVNGRMSKPEPVGRMLVGGGLIVLGFKFKASFDCTYDIEVDDPERFIPEPDYGY